MELLSMAIKNVFISLINAVTGNLATEIFDTVKLCYFQRKLSDFKGRVLVCIEAEFVYN